MLVVGLELFQVGVVPGFSHVGGDAWIFPSWY